MPDNARTLRCRIRTGQRIVTDLFATANPAAPLADRLRPTTIDEMIGQRHLLAPGKPLAVAFASGKPHSMILWGPPGVGKTTLARLMAARLQCRVHRALGGAVGCQGHPRCGRARGGDARAIAAGTRSCSSTRSTASTRRSRTRSCPYVEQGLVTFIGATTENPSFEVNSALLSRAAVYVLEPLSEDELGQLLDRALAVGAPGLSIAAEARATLIAYADGDGRRLVNLVEYLATAAGEGRTAPIDVAFVEATIARSLRRFDKGGEAFYDQISALHKSVRGSNPDAALYWMCRMLDGGADPLYVGRRLIRMATEDIGLADPRALSLTTAAVETYERLGTPEGELALAEAVIYLACAAKSNAVYTAYNAARAFIAEDGSRPVPLRLRNAPTKLMKGLGYGKGYRYAHDEEDAYAAGERYFPDNMPEVSWYEPTDRGLEAKIREKLEELRARDRKARDEEA